MSERTVWGLSLWNSYYGDSALAIRACNFTEIIFADDLNAFKVFDNSTLSDEIHRQLHQVQFELHSWGRANRVQFDANKESHHIISKVDPYGASFRLLGVDFDVKLIMDEAVNSLIKEVSWKLKSLFRCNRIFSTKDLVLLFKSHILGFIEYRTPALLHASCSVLQPLDNVLDRFLKKVGLSNIDALTEFNLAPLQCRRDIAALGIIHRAILGLRPPHFRQFFRLETQ